VNASREAANAAANGQGLGGLFEYKLKDKVTLKKNQSALVPIAQTEIEAEKVSLRTGTSGSGRPLRGLWLKNASPLTLDGGSSSVLENEVFAGEGLTDPIKPGERRTLSYATDFGLLVEAQTSGEPMSALYPRRGSDALFLKQGTITPEMAQALQRITAQKAVVAKLEEEMENRQKDMDRIVDDQGRLRENMKALRGQR
jgi:hypothetical protein